MHAQFYHSQRQDSYFCESRGILFLRTVLQAKLAGVLLTFVVSTYKNDSFPLSLQQRCWRRSFFYFSGIFDECLARKSAIRFSRHVLLVPLYHAKFSKCPGQGVLRRARRMCVSPRVKAFFFRNCSHQRSPRDCICFMNCKCLECIDHESASCWDAIIFCDVLEKNRTFYANPNRKWCLALHKHENTL